MLAKRKLQRAPGRCIATHSIIGWGDPVANRLDELFPLFSHTVGHWRAKRLMCGSPHLSHRPTYVTSSPSPPSEERTNLAPMMFANTARNWPGGRPVAHGSAAVMWGERRKRSLYGGGYMCFDTAAVLLVVTLSGLQNPSSYSHHIFLARSFHSVYRSSFPFPQRWPEGGISSLALLLRWPVKSACSNNNNRVVEIQQKTRIPMKVMFIINKIRVDR